MKKIIFFDGDGTLWYPRSTKRTKKPHWVYHDSNTQENYLEHIMLIPGVLKILKKLYAQKIILAVISANPNAESEALKEMQEKLEYFKINQYFAHCLVSDGADPKGKTKKILSTIKQMGLSPDDALMIGDSYYYDYLAAKKVGVDALYIENEYSKKPEVMPDGIESVSETVDIIWYLESSGCYNNNPIFKLVADFSREPHLELLIRIFSFSSSPSHDFIKYLNLKFKKTDLIKFKMQPLKIYKDNYVYISEKGAITLECLDVEAFKK